MRFTWFVLLGGLVLCLASPAVRASEGDDAPAGTLFDSFVRALEDAGVINPFPTRRCHGDQNCGPRHYCAKPIGHCDGAGHCRRRPQVCPENYDPVCGCDGQTYANACFAAMAGVSLAHLGECPAPCHDNDDCAANTQYCAKQPGDCDGEGRCHDRPTGCPDIYDPVCGCDGNTYSNACDAAAAGVNLAYEGECHRICGGITGVPCPDGEFCRLPDGQCCCDIQGVCAPVPQACPDVYDPVCGCDGQTYGNRCEADMAGVSVDHEGECERVCGGIAGIPCPDGEFCLLPDGSCCCDHQGVCHHVPQVCPDIYDPVCGCDGVTYGNRCEAAMAGQSVDHPGECDRGCLRNEDCLTSANNAYCQKPVGHCDARGECHPRPNACPDVYDPVCGCDGVTYGNACEAAAAGVSIHSEGECP